jgi:hypothetical protein
MSLIQIYEGWKNKLLPDKELKHLIHVTTKERIEICNNCEFHSSNRVGYKSLRPDAHCTDCGCTLSAKTACLSCACPKDKWLSVMTRQQEDEIDKDGASEI